MDPMGQGICLYRGFPVPELVDSAEALEAAWVGAGRISSCVKSMVVSGSPKRSKQFIATSAEVTPNGGLVRESYTKWP